MNKIFLIGNLTRDPELRTTPNGHTVCSFGLAVNRRQGKAAAEGGQNEAEFFTISAWRQLGETCARYLSKGRKCAVVGELRSRSYDGNDGVKRFVMEVDADNVEFLPSANQQGGGEYGASAGGGMAPQASYAPQAAPAAPSGYAPAETGFTQVDEDELPF